MQRSIFGPPATAGDSRSNGALHGIEVARPAAPAIGRRLSRAAGFYSHEVDAVLAARQLRERCDLAPSQVSVMRDGGRVPGAVEPVRTVSAAAIGAVAAAALAAAAAVFEPALYGLDGVLLVLGMAITGAILGTAVDVVLGWGPLGIGNRRSRRFDHMVDQQLAAGAWVVLVQAIGQLSPARQALTLELLRASSYKWCADAPRKPVDMI